MDWDQGTNRDADPRQLTSVDTVQYDIHAQAHKDLCTPDSGIECAWMTLFLNWESSAILVRNYSTVN